MAGFNIIYGKPAVKVVKFGLVWDAMARSLGTPDERMCEYFDAFAYFILIFCTSSGFKLAIH